MPKKLDVEILVDDKPINFIERWPGNNAAEKQNELEMPEEAVEEQEVEPEIN